MKKERLDQELILALKGKLREIRLNRGKTQEQVLKTTGIHIGRIENRNYVMNVNITTLKVLCDLYNTTLADLFKGVS